MIVDKIWTLTNTVRVGLVPRSSHAQVQATFPDKVCSRLFPSTEEGGKGKKVRTTSHDAGGKFVSEKSKSAGGKFGGPARQA